MYATKMTVPNNNMDAAIQTPITDAAKISIHIQNHGICRDFEFELAKCVEAYGFYKGQEKCIDLIHDLNECLRGEKRRSRNDILYSEYTRQVLAGEREKYEEPPHLAFIH